MFSFLKRCARSITWLRVTLFNVLFIALVFVIISAMFAKKPTVTIANNSALHIAPYGFLVDKYTYTPSPLNLFSGDGRTPETRVYDLVRSITLAGKDSRISTIFLQVDQLYGGGLSKLEEIGQALKRFKQTGKTIIAYGDSYTQQQYYLASFADTIYINKMGSVLLTGYGSYRNYLKEAIDKLSLTFHIFRVGDYKDAVEPLMRTEMSDASREHNKQWVWQLWRRYTQQVEQARNLTAGALDQYISTSGEQTRLISNAEFALQSRLVDQIISRVALRELLIERFGHDKKSNSFAAVNMRDYLDATKNADAKAEHTIGLIIAAGQIIDGSQSDGNIGGDSLAKLLQLAREDESLDALVIRVDSGGGSVFASEIIREEIAKTRSQDLPIFISMGSMAASGGYWIATAADEIWATPATITGSIGVWGVLPNVTESLKRLGVYTDGVGTSVLADVMRPDRPLSEPAKQVIQNGVDNVYRHFLSLVAKARGQDIEQIHQVAQGRVWTGERAKALGLVDQLGSLTDVFNALAKQHNLDGYRVRLIEKPLTTREQLVRTLMQEAKVLGLETGRAVKAELLPAAASPLIETVFGTDGIDTGAATSWNTLLKDKDKLSFLAKCIACYVH